MSRRPDWLGRASLVAALLLAGCSAVLVPTRWQRDVGIIDIGGGGVAPIQLPDTVRVGSAFTAVVLTFGSSTCTRADGAEVEVDGRVAVITPYDRYATGDVVCTDDLAPFAREVELRFDAAGEARVRVLGRGPGEAAAEHETTLQVRP